MKKILLFLILLVNLQVEYDTGSFNIRFGEIAAQVFLAEQLAGIPTVGQNTLCYQCGQEVTGGLWYLEHHKHNSCSNRLVTCAFCNQTYAAYYGHQCSFYSSTNIWYSVNGIYTPSPYEILFRSGIPIQNLQQDMYGNCVPTSMTNLLAHTGQLTYPPGTTRDMIMLNYPNNVNWQKGPDSYQVSQIMMQNGFVNIPIDQIRWEIDNGNPCLGVIPIRNKDGSIYAGHMVEIIGYYTNVPAYQTIDPATGTMKSYPDLDFYNFNGQIYSK